MCGADARQGCLLALVMYISHGFCGLLTQPNLKWGICLRGEAESLDTHKNTNTRGMRAAAAGLPTKQEELSGIAALARAYSKGRCALSQLQIHALYPPTAVSFQGNSLMLNA